MSARTEATLDILAAMLVLFSTMLDARLSVTLAVAFLIVFAIYKLVTDHRHKPS